MQYFILLKPRISNFTKNSNPDLYPTVSCWCTRVSCRNDNDCKIFFNTKGKIDDVRIVGASSLMDHYTWVDTTYPVQNDMCSQERVTMLFGWVTINCKNNK